MRRLVLAVIAAIVLPTVLSVTTKRYGLAPFGDCDGDERTSI